MASTPKSKKVATITATSKTKEDKPVFVPGEETTQQLTTPMEVSSDSGLQTLLLDSVKDIFWAENHLVKALPKMQSATGSSALASAIGDHLAVTKNQVMRLEKVFELLGAKVQAKKCDAMEGLTKEGEAVIESTEAGTPARDLGIIMASRKVEHYEMAAYTGLQNLATTLGFTEVASLFAETLSEESESDNILGSLAETDINYSGV